LLKLTGAWVSSSSAIGPPGPVKLRVVEYSARFLFVNAGAA
jgi:hypothetical protein